MRSCFPVRPYWIPYPQNKLAACAQHKPQKGTRKGLEMATPTGLMAHQLVNDTAFSSVTFALPRSKSGDVVLDDHGLHLGQRWRR